MTRFNLLAGFAVSALTISNVVAYGATKTWVGTDGIWNDADNWSPTGVPAANDEIVIPSAASSNPTFSGAGGVANAFDRLEIEAGRSLAVSGNISVKETIVGEPMGSNASLVIVGGAAFTASESMLVDAVGTVQVGFGASPADLLLTGSSFFTGLELAANATINVAANSMIEFDSSSGVFDAQIRGTITLPTSTSLILISDDTDFDFVTSPGVIQLGNAAAEIFIVPGMTLTSKIDTKGVGVIESDFDITFGNGTFANEGMVVANGSGALVLGSDLDLTDTGSSLWKAEGSSAVLRFLKNATGLDGQVRADEGTIEIGSGVSLATSGRLTGEDGGLVIACDATFAATGTPLPTGFTSPLSDNRFLFDDTDSGANQNNCP